MQSFLFKTLIFFHIFLLSLYAWNGADSYYVTPTGTSSTCENFINSCSFQKALDNADGDGRSNTLYIGAGTYNISTPLTFGIQENKSLTIEGDSSATTILDAGFSSRLFVISGGAGFTDVHVTLKNLTFRKGSDNAQNGNGLYVYLKDSNITLEHNRFLQNGSNDGLGGGAYIQNEFGNIVVRRNIFRGNGADAGGGIYLKTSSGNIDIIDNEFTNNSVSSALEHHGGGGLYVDAKNGHAVVTNNIFTDNSTLNYGGGLYTLTQSYGITHVVNNTFLDNSAMSFGGDIFNKMTSDSTFTTVINNIFWDNNADLMNDIYMDNQGDSSGATCYFHNNILGIIGYYASVPAEVNYSSNIYENPRFSGTITLPDGRQSLRLLAGSSAIDAGNECASGSQPTDYEGGSRVVGSNVNLGAVETVVPNMSPIYYLLLH